MSMRALLLLVVSLVLLTAASAQSCAHFTHDALLDRLDLRLGA